MRRKLFLFLAVLVTLPAHAHIGSPDTFVQATAGPYKFLVTAHPPSVCPGALELDLRLNPDDHITTVTASLDNGAPTPIHIFDAGTATTSIWLPNASAHSLHILVQGSAYDLTLPASSSVPRPPNNSFSIALIVLALAFFGFGSWKAFTGGRRLGFTLIVIAIIPLGLAASAFITEAINNFYFGRHTTIVPTLTADGHLNITLSRYHEDFADIVPDHGKLMHLFLVRQPQQDVFLHLHPQQLSPGQFSVPLPAMPPGTYRLFADYYLAPGGDLKDARGETSTITLDLPAQFRPSAAPDPDDSIAVIQSAGVADSSAASSPMSGVAKSDGVQYISTLRDGYTLQLVAPATIQPLRANLFQVTLLDPSGHPPSDMALYLGMPAHAVVLRSDNSVFAHIHPGGTLPMLDSPMHSMPDMPGMSMPMDMPMSPASNTATIPYGFPSAGHYRLFVQMKHGPIIETAAFDIEVQ